MNIKRHQAELEKMLHLLIDGEMWETLAEADLAKVGALKILHDMREMVALMQGDISAVILELKAFEKLDEIRSLIDARFYQLTG